VSKDTGRAESCRQARFPAPAAAFPYEPVDNPDSVFRWIYEFHSHAGFIAVILIPGPFHPCLHWKRILSRKKFQQSIPDSLLSGSGVDMTFRVLISMVLLKVVRRTGLNISVISYTGCFRFFHSWSTPAFALIRIWRIKG
jgi:hypothetical protein